MSTSTTTSSSPNASTVLEMTFERVRRDYFPRWRSGAAWTVQEDNCSSWTGRDGCCDPQRRTITISALVVGEGEDDLVSTLIHEITHAVTYVNHGKRFCARLRKAAERAGELGEHGVMELLIDEARSISSGEMWDLPVAADIYDIVTDLVERKEGRLTLERLLQGLAAYTALTPDELLSRYRRLPQVYRDACRRTAEKRE